MPRKSKKQTKSAAIRAYIASHPAAGPTEVSQALKKQGVDVSPAQVSNVKTTSKRPKSRAANGRRNGRKSVSTDVISLTQLVEARRFADQVGGVDAGIDLLQSLGKLVG
jgi:hypothetical protein